MKSKILMVVVFILVVLNVYSYKRSVNTEIDLIYAEDELAEILKEIYPANVMVDLREREDYERGHIGGFINIPSSSGVELLEYLNKNELEKKTIYLMCYSGKRAAAAFELLRSKGYNHLTYITFGYDEYLESQNEFIPEIGECDCLAD